MGQGSGRPGLRSAQGGEEVAGGLLDEQGEYQVGHQPASGESGVFGRQFIDAKAAFEAFIAKRLKSGALFRRF